MSDSLHSKPNQPNQPLPEGSIFAHYTILRLLGRGGMGEVYEVRHNILQQNFALKLLRPDVTETPGSLDKFHAEARVMSQLQHENVLRVDDVGDTNGRAFLRMELAPGLDAEGRIFTTLEDYLSFHRTKPAWSVKESQAATYITQLLKGLAYAHSQNFVHRDIKPANLLFFGDTLKISDFGLVHILPSEEGQAGGTLIDLMETIGPQQQGAVRQAIEGSLNFMSPETRSGSGTDHRSDLFAAGIIAFQLLTGRVVPDMRKPSDIAPWIDTAWDEWIVKALAEEPENRWQSADDMLDAMPGSTTAKPVAGKKSKGKPKAVAATTESASKSGGSKGILIAAVAILLLGGGAAGYLLFNSDQAEPTEETIADNDLADVSNNNDKPAKAAAATSNAPTNTAATSSPPSNNSQPSQNQFPPANSAPTASFTQSPQQPPNTGNTQVENTQQSQQNRDRTLDLGPGQTISLKWLEPGSFTSSNGPINLTQGFWIGKHEVTQGQFEAIMGFNPSFFKNSGSNAPVESISWNDAMDFCARLNERDAANLPEGYAYTLPTEAQWAYACRAGGNPPFANTGAIDSVGWHSKNSQRRTWPVGLKQPNAWGLYDMHGNVWEWCHDWFAARPSIGTNPTGPTSSALNMKIARGGSWGYLAEAEHRRSWDPSSRIGSIGFRVALAPKR